MKGLLFGAVLLGLVIVVPGPTLARVDIVLTLPPPIVFAAPPEVVVIPGTYVYAVPGIVENIFFYNGWWWRQWEGRWYRSHDYGAGWAYYQRVPSFYSRIPSGWRTYYRDRRWEGRQWNYQPIPYQQLQRNWRGWQKSRHWEKQRTWGVEGLRSRPPSRTMVKPQQRPGMQRPPQTRRQHQPQQQRPGMQRTPQTRQQHQPQQQRPGMQRAPQTRQQHQPQQQRPGVQRAPQPQQQPQPQQ